MRRVNKKLFILIPVLFLLAGGAYCFFLYKTPVTYENDVISFGRIAKESAKHWERIEEAEYEEIGYPFSVIAMDGTVKYQSSKEVTTFIKQALKMGNTIVDIEDNGRLLGKVIIGKNPADILLKEKKNTISILLSFTIFFTLSSGIYYYSLEVKLVKPFQDLKHFASEVSQGNFNYPIKMRKNNLFGDFTESFDRMREELMIAKEKEYQANKKQKELVASLSHDIKTPITSIQLTGELLLELEKDENLKNKLRMICQKTEQIEELVNNLFQTTLQDMEQLTVSCTETYSSILENIIRNADDKGKATITEIPECMIFIDELRLAQIFSNILNNSYKYADTDILIQAAVHDCYLKISISDSGQSIQEEEVPLIFNKFYRGRNASEKNGSGLGLYICKKLMEQMQGEIYGTCSEMKFTIVLMLKLV